MSPHPKRQKVESTTVEEIPFDLAARQDYLSGFHKRKLQRAKYAREIAEKKARADRIEERRKACLF
jgi:ribosomal RNA-processing protein 17